MYEQKENQNIGKEFVAIPKRLLSKLWGHYGAEKTIAMIVWAVYDSKWHDETKDRMCLNWTEYDWTIAKAIGESLIGEEDSKELWLINETNESKE